MLIRSPLLLTSALAFALACGDAATSPDLSQEPALAGSAPGSRMAYDAVGDCANGTLVDPGTVKVVSGVLIQRGTVFHCPMSGDLEGVVVLVQNLTLRNAGTPEATGRVFGTTELLIDKFFGRTDLQGTFQGPFNGSLEELVFGELTILRHGTGDYQGLVMQGVAVQDPPGSGIEVESGEIFGNALP